MNPLSELQMYVAEHSRQFYGGTNESLPDKFKKCVDVKFCKVGVDGQVNADELKRLAAAAREGAYCELDPFETEADFLAIGGWIGDQGLALQFMGMAEAVELGKVVTPTNIGTMDPMIQRLFPPTNLPAFLPK